MNWNKVEITNEDGDKVLTLKPYSSLKEASVYRVAINPNLRDTDGKKLEGKSSFKFKTKWLSKNHKLG